MGFSDSYSHILPGVDDGAKTIDEAITLLKQEKENGVTSVVLTPHFYPHLHNMDEHLEKCKASYESLKDAVKDMDLPKLYLGYEVQYFSGISHCTDLDKFCFENTNIILLELPFLSPLTQNMLDEIVKLDMDIGLSVIIAHIERYAGEKLFKKLLKIIKNGHAKAQISTDFIFDNSFVKPVNYLLKKDVVSFIASDAHNIETRPVCFNEAFSKLRVSFHSQLVKCIKNSQKLETTLKGNVDD